MPRPPIQIQVIHRDQRRLQFTVIRRLADLAQAHQSDEGEPEQNNDHADELRGVIEYAARVLLGLMLRLPQGLHEARYGEAHLLQPGALLP